MMLLVLMPYSRCNDRTRASTAPICAGRLRICRSAHVELLPYVRWTISMPIALSFRPIVCRHLMFVGTICHTSPFWATMKCAHVPGSSPRFTESLVNVLRADDAVSLSVKCRTIIEGLSRHELAP